MPLTDTEKKNMVARSLKSYEEQLYQAQINRAVNSSNSEATASLDAEIARLTAGIAEVKRQFSEQLKP